MDLVNQYKKAPKEFELVIYDNLFLLYEQTIEEPKEEGAPQIVHRGKFLKRAYWRDAAGISLEMMKSRLGIR